ncbi:hypothetical protein LZ31DRAFT_259333 [Colletotrichum somersetense]|nr:hypothetical protein LZ31DRAFT_259333 [Colletotrichum somersetense]
MPQRDPDKALTQPAPRHDLSRSSLAFDGFFSFHPLVICRLSFSPTVYPQIFVANVYAEPPTRNLPFQDFGSESPVNIDRLFLCPFNSSIQRLHGSHESYALPTDLSRPWPRVRTLVIRSVNIHLLNIRETISSRRHTALGTDLATPVNTPPCHWPPIMRQNTRRLTAPTARYVQYYVLPSLLDFSSS